MVQEGQDMGRKYLARLLVLMLRFDMVLPALCVNKKLMRPGMLMKTLHILLMISPQSYALTAWPRGMFDVQ